MKLAIFDFDGTITRDKKDSLIDFIFYAVGPVSFTLSMLCLVPVFLVYAFKLSDSGQTKAKVLTFFFKGWPEEKFKATAKRYGQEALPRFLRKEALEKIEWHKQQQHMIVVATASPEDYLKDWCDSQGLDLVGTQLEFKDGKFTGKLASNNCKGQEKVKRLLQKYNFATFEKVYAYGDSPADFALKELAHEFFYRSF